MADEVLKGIYPLGFGLSHQLCKVFDPGTPFMRKVDERKVGGG